jgi:hypothetical protein
VELQKMKSTSRSKEFVIGTVVTLITCSLCLVIGFYLVGVYELVAMRLPEVVTVGDPIVRFDKNIGFRASQNAKTTVTVPKLNLSYDLITDDTGARISATNPTYPDKPFITAVGCSFTWGHGVSNDETYARILETELGTKVHNYAMGSYGTVQSLKMLEKFGPGSDLVIYGFIDEHVRRNVTPCAPSFAPLCLFVPTVKKNSTGEFYIPDQVPRDNVTATDRFFGWAKNKNYFSLANVVFGRSFALDKIDELRGLHVPTVPAGEAVVATEFVMRKMEKFVSENQVRLLVVNVGIGFPPQNFEELSRKKWDDRVSFLDASKFDGVPDDQLLIPGDGHPNPTGHRMIAGKIYNAIKDGRLLEPDHNVGQDREHPNLARYLHQ